MLFKRMPVDDALGIAQTLLDRGDWIKSLSEKKLLALNPECKEVHIIDLDANTVSSYSFEEQSQAEDTFFRLRKKASA